MDVGTSVASDATVLKRADFQMKSQVSLLKKSMDIASETVSNLVESLPDPSGVKGTKVDITG